MYGSRLLAASNDDHPDHCDIFNLADPYCADESKENDTAKMSPRLPDGWRIF